MIMNKKPVYVIHYGEYTSATRFSNWYEASRFIKWCLDNGTRVREVEKI